MSNYFLNQFKNNFPLTAPYAAEQKLEARFPSASSIEWFKVGENYAALFTSENRDCMAQMNSLFEITSYKINTPSGLLPENIQKAGANMGSISNAILIWDKGNILYELTVLDLQLQRFKVLLNASGTVLKKF